MTQGSESYIGTDVRLPQSDWAVVCRALDAIKARRCFPSYCRQLAAVIRRQAEIEGVE